MHVGAAKISLRIHGSTSLKDRRRAVQSALGKLRARHAVSAADVSEHDSWQLATIGISAVSNDTRTLRSTIDRAVGFVERASPEAEVTRVVTDFWAIDDY